MYASSVEVMDAAAAADDGETGFFIFWVGKDEDCRA